MPYYISDSAEGCAGWATIKEDGEVMGCHATKQDAIDQGLAIAQAEDSTFEGERAMPGTLKPGNFVSWKDHGETYQGRIREVVTSGTIDIPGSGVQIAGTFFDPAALVQMYEQVDGQWVEASTFLGLLFSQLSGISALVDDEMPEFSFDEPLLDDEPDDGAPEGYHYMPDGTLMLDSEHEGERAAPDALVVDDFVSWNSSGGRVRGQIERIERSGTINVPDSEFTIEGTEDDPAALIRVWRESEEGYEASETLVGHKFSTLTKISSLRSVGVEQRQVNLTPPAYMRASARQGLKYHEEGLSGDGLRPETVREARAMAEGNVTADKWVRLAAWIARHLVDLDAPAANPNNEDYPSAGVVAHLLWGSGPSKRSARRALEYAEGVVGRLEEENRQRVSVEAKEMAKIETRTNSARFEVRELDGGGMTFTGYAAVFNAPSEPLPFIERIAPGAFKRSLDSRNDIKLLWNHDTGVVLGSRRAGTLRLEEDNYGLRVSADLPDTQAGRDAAYLIKRGDVDAMSFGFSVPKGGDEWVSDNERVLRSVRLIETSVVPFPAYSQTSGSTSVRGLDKVARRASVNADALADAIVAIESDSDLTEEQTELLAKVISELGPKSEEPAETVESEELDADMLELKKKKLEQLLKRI
jgi:HK97 family phage prohead protease